MKEKIYITTIIEKQTTRTNNPLTSTSEHCVKKNKSAHNSITFFYDVKEKEKEKRKREQGEGGTGVPS